MSTGPRGKEKGPCSRAPSPARGAPDLQGLVSGYHPSRLSSHPAFPSLGQHFWSVHGHTLRLADMQSHL